MTVNLMRWGKGTLGIGIHLIESNPGVQSIQPKFQPVRPGKVVHLKWWTRFFETFPVGLNHSIEFWTKISGNFGGMDCAPGHILSYSSVGKFLKPLHLTPFVSPKQIAWFSERNFPFVISSFIHSHNVEFPTKTKQNVDAKSRGLFIGHSTLHF